MYSALAGACEYSIAKEGEKGKRGEKRMAKFTERQKKRQRKDDFVKEVMLEMEKREFTVGDVERFMRKLKQELEWNSERIQSSKPFTVYKMEDYLS